MSKNDQLKMPATLFGKKGSRRDFLRNTAATALAGGALAACSSARLTRADPEGK